MSLLNFLFYLYQGIQPLLSRNYGIKNYRDADAILRYAMVTMLIVSAVVYAVVFFGAREITHIFNSEQNAALQAIAQRGLRLYFIACPFARCNILISMYFTSTERPRPAHLISILRGFLVIIPMAFLLSSMGGVDGVWCAFPVTELLVAITGLTLFFAVRRREKQSS